MSQSLEPTQAVVDSGIVDGGIVDGGIATLPPPDETPDRSPISPRTGEPRRPLLIWLVSALGLASTIIVACALGAVFWNSIPEFAEASWINGRMDTDPGSWVRVAFSVINTVIGATVGGATAFFAYHVFIGHAWTRWAGIIATVLSCLSLMLTPLAMISIAPVGIGAILVWVPTCRRFFNAWAAQRTEGERRIELPDRIIYGPLPRYR